MECAAVRFIFIPMALHELLPNDIDRQFGAGLIVRFPCRKHPVPLLDNAQLKQLGDQSANAAPKALLGIEHKGEKHHFQRKNT